MKKLINILAVVAIVMSASFAQAAEKQTCLEKAEARIEKALAKQIAKDPTNLEKAANNTALAEFKKQQAVHQCELSDAQKAEMKELKDNQKAELKMFKAGLPKVSKKKA